MENRAPDEPEDTDAIPVAIDPADPTLAYAVICFRQAGGIVPTQTPHPSGWYWEQAAKLWKAKSNGFSRKRNEERQRIATRIIGGMLANELITDNAGAMALRDYPSLSDAEVERYILSHLAALAVYAADALMDEIRKPVERVDG